MSLHISVDHMNGESWLLFALILAPALILFVWTAFKVQRDARDVAVTVHPEPPSEVRRLH